MRHPSLMLACVIVALVSPFGRLEAQENAHTTTVALPSGETVEIVTESMRFPASQGVVKIELPAGTTATRADGGEVTFPAGATITLPAESLRALVQPSPPPPPVAPRRQSPLYWMVWTTRMQFVEGRPLMQVMGPFPNAALCDTFLKDFRARLKEQGEGDFDAFVASSGCRTDVTVTGQFR